MFRSLEDPEGQDESRMEPQGDGSCSWREVDTGDTRKIGCRYIVDQRGNRLAERVGFEPTCPLLAGKTLSRRPRYDRFGTSPACSKLEVRNSKIENRNLSAWVGYSPLLFWSMAPLTWNLSPALLAPDTWHLTPLTSYGGRTTAEFRRILRLARRKQPQPDDSLWDG